MSILKKLVKFTSDIYLTSHPLFILYKPILHKVKGHEVRKLLDELEIGDILLRRFDGYLNTILTPGFWGHSAIYIGENKILHSVSKGVCEEDILDFCRTDSICILRRKEFDVNIFIDKCDAVKKQNIKYDFEFDENDDEYYCTELINVVHDNIFDKAFTNIHGKSVLIPDSIYDDSDVSMILEFRH